MHIHILGICGKFMSGLAFIANQLGFKVTGSDANLNAPAAHRLGELGIPLYDGYAADSIDAAADCVVIGNALSRGQPIIERILNEGIPYCSGPEWLGNQVLRKKWVLAVSGTHGKTTTSSMLAWILECAGYEPGYLIGGNPHNFAESARCTDSNFFVIEADEYDTAFFDKRSKFLHYHPKTLIINNLEFDHADIFESLSDIQRQFSQVLTLVPSQGQVISPRNDPAIETVLKNAVWTSRQTFGDASANWDAKLLQPDGRQVAIYQDQKIIGKLVWDIVGEHNVKNALAAIAAAHHVGILPLQAIKALETFSGVKRQLELKGSAQNITIYDDFAHHPTAIAATLTALRRRVGKERIFAVLEFGSNTMRDGHHHDSIVHALQEADHVVLLQPKNTTWSVEAAVTELASPKYIGSDVADLISHLVSVCKPGDHVLCMSNQSFDGLHQRLLHELTGT